MLLNVIILNLLNPNVPLDLYFYYFSNSVFTKEKDVSAHKGGFAHTTKHHLDIYEVYKKICLRSKKVSSAFFYFLCAIEVTLTAASTHVSQSSADAKHD